MCVWDSYVYQKVVLCFLIHKSYVSSIKRYCFVRLLLLLLLLLFANPSFKYMPKQNKIVTIPSNFLAKLLVWQCAVWWPLVAIRSYKRVEMKLHTFFTLQYIDLSSQVRILDILTTGQKPSVKADKWLDGSQSRSECLITKRPRQIKHQLDATLCRFYFCRVTLHVSGVKRPSSGVLKKLARRPLVHAL